MIKDDKIEIDKTIEEKIEKKYSGNQDKFLE